MFFDIQDIEYQNKYVNLLKIMGSLSRLSSDSNVPYLYYRMAENIFCKVFDATNLARSDISLDAKKDHLGLGLKTFINKSSGPVEKIAEFNKNKHLIDGQPNLTDKIKYIAKLRNERLETTSGISGVDVDNMIYHCVVRDTRKFIFHEDEMRPISINDISNIRDAGRNVVSFADGIYEYSFNFSKSTLYKRFLINPIYETDIAIFDDPYEILESMSCFNNCTMDQSNVEINKIYLPLYSYTARQGNYVPLRSGLNQWNANGRTRNLNEVYISIPAIIHRKFPDFFPQRDEVFTLKIPNGSSLMTKVCQDGGKALMSNPNQALGNWILRDILKLEEGELLTYQKLEEIGIDTVEVSKFSDGTFAINFKQLGTYQDFYDTISR